VVCHPTLRAGEFAGVDRCIDQLLEPDAVFVVGNIYARNAVDHIQGGNFANVAAAQFYKKGDTFFVVFVIMPDRIYIDWTDESSVQGQPGPKISLCSFSGVGESLKVGSYSGFGGLNRIPHIARLSFPGNPGDNPQTHSGKGQHSGDARKAEGDEGDRITRYSLPEGFAILALVVFCVSGCVTLIVLLGISWWCGWLR
jgi:hypothetical protein